MSSPITINRSTSPTSTSGESSYTSTSFSTSSSSSNTSQALIYTREELLALATSPLAQTYTPALVSLPGLMRKTRRSVAEAQQVLEYSRIIDSPASPFKSKLSSYRPNEGSWGTDDVHVPHPRPTPSPTERRRKQPSRASKALSWRRTEPLQTNDGSSPSDLTVV